MTHSVTDPFGALAALDLSEGKTSFYRLTQLDEDGIVSLDRLAHSSIPAWEPLS